MQDFIEYIGVFFIFFLVPFVIPFVLTTFNIINSFTKKKIGEMYTDIIILFLGSFLTGMLMFWLALFYEMKEFELWFILPITGFIGMIKLVTCSQIYSSFWTLIYIDMVITGIIVSLAFMVWNICNYYNILLMYLFLFPINYIISGVRIIRKNIAIHIQYLENPENDTSKWKFADIQKKFLDKKKLSLMIIVSVLPVALISFPLSMVIEKIINMLLV